VEEDVEAAPADPAATTVNVAGGATEYLKPDGWTFAHLLQLLMSHVPVSADLDSVRRNTKWVMQQQDRWGIRRGPFEWTMILSIGTSLMDVQRLQRLFQHLMSETEVDVHHVAQYIVALGKLGAGDDVIIGTLNILRDNNLSYDASLLNALLTAMKVGATDPSIVSRVFDLFEVANLRPNNRTLTAAFAYLLRCGNEKHIMEAYEFGKKHGVDIDAITARSLMAALSSRNVRAYGLAEQMAKELEHLLPLEDSIRNIDILRKQPEARVWHAARGRMDIEARGGGAGRSLY
jgi:hypothetical protein